MRQSDRGIKRSLAAIDPAPSLKKEVKVELEFPYPIFDCFVLQRDRPTADFIVVYWSCLVDFSSDDFIYLVGVIYCGPIHLVSFFSDGNLEFGYGLLLCIVLLIFFYWVD